MRKSNWIEENEREQELYDKSLLSHYNDEENDAKEINVFSHWLEDSEDDYEPTIRHFSD